MSVEAKGEKMSSLVTQTIALNDEMSRQLRTMSYLLHPPMLDEAVLPSALQWYVNGFAQRSGVAVDLHVSPEFGRLPEDMEIGIFRVVQECLINVHRHSGSNSAKIQVMRTNDQVDVTISDTGKGISANHLHGDKVIPGVGLMGIQERMRQFGGTTEIKSSDGGTTVRAQIPLQIEPGQ